MTDFVHETQPRLTPILALRVALKTMRAAIEAYAARRASRAVSAALWLNGDDDVARCRRRLLRTGL